MAVATSTALLAAAGATAGAGALDNRNQRKALKSMEEQKAASQAFIEKQIEKSRGDIFKLFPSVQDSLQQGVQAGLDVTQQAFPVQLAAFQKGNVGAQEQLISGLPQMNNAILGMPIDYSAFQPTRLRNVDTGVSGLTMPNAPQLKTPNELGLG